MNVKEKIRKARVYQWEVAEKIGVTEFTLSRMLRRPEKLGSETVEKIEAAIKEILAEQGA